MFYMVVAGSKILKFLLILSRINAAFGTDWQAEQRIYPVQVKDIGKEDLANIYITCTDNISSRFELAKALEYLSAETGRSHDDHRKPYYWLDFGNARTTGQAILGTVQAEITQPKSKKYRTVASLPWITRFGDYTGLNDETSGPSCSLAEALHQQNLLVNSAVAIHGCDILWKMFRRGMLHHHGVYVNLDTMRVNPVPV